eukprot:6199988-Pleurochrysis_carterae.AAC.7
MMGPLIQLVDHFLREVVGIETRQPGASGVKPTAWVCFGVYAIALHGALAGGHLHRLRLGARRISAQDPTAALQLIVARVDPGRVLGTRKPLAWSKTSNFSPKLRVEAWNRLSGTKPYFRLLAYGRLCRLPLLRCSQRPRHSVRQRGGQVAQPYDKRRHVPNRHAATVCVAMTPMAHSRST